MPTTNDQPTSREEYPAKRCSAFFRTKYRIVKDGYAGYEAQFKRWWFPVWMQCGFCNTSGTVEQARKICDLHSRGGVVEEYLPNPTADRRATEKERAHE